MTLTNYTTRSFKNNSVRVVFFLTLVLSSFIVFAQDNWVNPEHKDKRYPGFKTGWFAGLDAGATLFYGDIALYNNFPKPKDFNKSFGNGYSFYGGKKFRFGLTAELQGFKGNLQGYKISENIYPRYFTADVLDYSLSLKYNLSQELFRQSQQRKFFNRLTLFATVGAGQTFFRNRLYEQVHGNWILTNANGYSITSIDSGNVKNKTGMTSAIIIPVGGKINFKLNKTTDLAFDVRYITVLSDQLDGWSRSWTHYDKYLYMAVGLVYNFGQKAEEDLPKDQRFFMPGKEEASSGSADEKVEPSEKPKRGLFSKKVKKSDKDFELKLKMYELQLRLFEMLYLSN